MLRYGALTAYATNDPKSSLTSDISPVHGCFQCIRSMSLASSTCRVASTRSVSFGGPSTLPGMYKHLTCFPLDIVILFCCYTHNTRIVMFTIEVYLRACIVATFVEFIDMSACEPPSMLSQLREIIASIVLDVVGILYCFCIGKC